MTESSGFASSDGRSGFSGLKHVNVKRSGLRLHDFAGAFVAGRKTIAFVERFGDHDLALAIHQVEWSRFLQGDADSQSSSGIPDRCINSL